MKKIFSNKIKFAISNYASDNNIPGIITILENFLQGVTDIKTSTNEYYMLKFLNWLKYGEKLPHAVFTIGNSKLPFLSFSTLPGVTCPGAGACLEDKYCYSFKAWRQPGAFLRQVQNTLLLNNFDIIEKELNNTLYTKKGNFRKAFQDMNKIDFRLYVDGDFSNITDLKNWMQLLKNNPVINAYGYSKSLNLFLQLHDDGFKFPENYVLNLSNGGIHDSLRPILKNLYFVRGNFTAIKSNKKEIRNQFKNKVFICPGKCGICTKIGHACGNNDTFNNMEIVIPIH
tara:strand:- start:39 stop:893 length:855 start_codon:yes stop_codon:yes gene_type:complete